MVTNNNFDAKQPLVSVVVITYNSAEFVVETLESIKNQTYANIELILTDDASKDTTVTLCEKWLTENKARFVRTELITVAVNKGVVQNCNRGFAATRGEWIKLIAGDDCLATGAIAKMIIYVNAHEECEILHAPVLKFSKNNKGLTNFENLFSDQPKVLNKEVPAAKQFEILTKGCVVNAPAVLIKTTLVGKIGEFDTEIPNCEDWPYWLKITRLGIPFHYIPEPLAYYRVREDSVYSSGSKEFYITSFYKTEYLIFKKYIKPYVSFFQKNITLYDFYLKKIFAKSKASLGTKVLFTSLRLPVKMYHKFS
ncbi:glycosyltransferase [Flavobacterium sp. GT2N3]|uniref:glycosyltransferase n=1 Tax=unclassified Flavobacterium TaxID=196869 RepID=UPI003AACE7B9